MRLSFFCVITALIFYSCKNDSREVDSVAPEENVKTIQQMSEDSIRLVAGASSIADSILLTDIYSSKMIEFQDIVEKGATYFYFSNVHCDACIVQELKLISEIVPYEKMILLATGTTKRNLRIFLRGNGISEKFRCYLMNENSGSILGSIMVPTMFRLTEDNRPYAIHFSRLGLEDSTKSYLFSAIK